LLQTTEKTNKQTNKQTVNNRDRDERQTAVYMLLSLLILYRS